MPHSTTDQPPPDAEEDTEIPDAPPPDCHETDSERSRDGSVADKLRTNGVHKQEVKLEDLFNDDEDDDDEYTASSTSVDKGGNSPPAAPV